MSWGLYGLAGEGEGGVRWGAQMVDAGVMVVVISPSSYGGGREREREWQVVQGHVVRNIWCYLREREGGGGGRRGGKGGGSERESYVWCFPHWRPDSEEML